MTLLFVIEMRFMRNNPALSELCQDKWMVTEEEPAVAVGEAVNRKKLLLYFANLVTKSNFMFQIVPILDYVVLHTFISHFFLSLLGLFCVLPKAINLLFIYCMVY